MVHGVNNFCYRHYSRPKRPRCRRISVLVEVFQGLSGAFGQGVTPVSIELFRFLKGRSFLNPRFVVIRQLRICVILG